MENRFENFAAKYGTPVAVLIGMSVIAVSIYFSFGIPNKKAAQNLNNNTSVAGTQVPVSSPPTIDDDPVLGDSDAPVTLIEFSDFQCPFCRKLWREVLPEIKKNYIDTGKAKLVYRDFPLPSIHPSAQISAEAGECADEQGKFWEMHDKIFSEQQKQGPNTIQYTEADLKKWAEVIGIDISQFNDCLASHKYEAEVEKDLADGQAAGITGTPGTFVNGKLLKGAQPYAAFAKAIDEVLEKK